MKCILCSIWIDIYTQDGKNRLILGFVREGHIWEMKTLKLSFALIRYSLLGAKTTTLFQSCTWLSSRQNFLADNYFFHFRPAASTPAIPNADTSTLPLVFSLTDLVHSGRCGCRRDWGVHVTENDTVFWIFPVRPGYNSVWDSERLWHCQLNYT